MNNALRKKPPKMQNTFLFLTSAPTSKFFHFASKDIGAYSGAESEKIKWAEH